MKINVLASICAIFFSPSILLAQELSITIRNPAPVTVPQFGKVSAFYTVSNITHANLTGIFVKNLPDNVTQVTCDPKYCGLSFNLGPQGSANDSCILKLTVKGPVNASSSDLLVCTTSECDITNDPLNISLGEKLPFINISVGSYSNYHNGIFPLLAGTNDSGNTWIYPEAIFKNLKDEIDPNFSNGILSSASCNNSFTKSVCVAAGTWCTGTFCDNPLPLVAVGLEQATNWRYPHSVFENLKMTIDPNFTGGGLRSSSCFGSGDNTVCIAGGTYTNGLTNLPLLARTGNGGNDWTYPTSIFQNLTTTVDPEFKYGAFFTASCTKSTCDSVCIASGYFCKTTECHTQTPLLALSKDKGLTWTYPHEVFQDLNTKIDPNIQDAFLVSSSCTGEGNQSICTSVGSFSNNNSLMPLLALTKDSGNTWTYPSEIFKNLDTVIGHGFTGGTFNATSCSGSDAKALCIAVGNYFRRGNGIPFLALTRNGGQSWAYPDFIYTKLKTVVDPDFGGGNFDGASCTGTGKKGICAAAGYYCKKSTALCLPLIAVTNNGGKSWFYPPSVYSDVLSEVDPNLTFGFFSDVSCKGTAEHNFCVATGQFSNTSFATFPLLAYSSDSGQTWYYPSAIFQNLTAKIDPDLAIASFVKDATSGGAFKLWRSKYKHRDDSIEKPKIQK